MNLIKATFNIVGESPLSFSKKVFEEKDANESHDDYDKRTWRFKIHHDEKTGEAFIPNMALKFCLDDTAQFLKIKVPGQNRSTFGQVFKCGVLVLKPIMLGVKWDDKKRIVANPQLCGTTGKRGPGPRVTRTFPQLAEWQGTAEVLIQAPELTKEVFQKHIESAGYLKGLGQFAPRVGGYCGRFRVENLTWERIE